MAPLFVGLPRQAEDRSELQSEYLKYVLNFFCSCLFYAFSTPSCTGGDVDKQASRGARASTCNPHRRTTHIPIVEPHPRDGAEERAHSARPPTPLGLQVLRLIRQLTAQCTWSENVVSITRNLLSSLLVKILQVRGADMSLV